MVNIRSINEILLSLQDFLKIAQPNLDTKVGTVARDLFIEAPASQLAVLYDELSSVSDKQSLRLVIGSDLDKLAKNFGMIRKQATTSSGIALLTFSSITSTININPGDSVIANNGFSYTVLSGVSVNSSATNFYKSVASKFRDQLDVAGISDQFAVEVTVTATSPGSSGNIGKYSLTRTSIQGVSNVTNVNPFVGGTDQEADAAFRNRVLSTFSGSSIGTALGYQSVALSTTGVSDTVVVEPGDPLMTRDGSKVKVNNDGTRTVISEGSGGKVDVIVLGTKLLPTTDSFIYTDKSNNNDPASSKNNFVLGQIVGDENKTINKKRVDNIKAGTLPTQPVEELISVSGSISGANFIPKSIDSLGRVTGNFELLKDVGAFGGSPFGFDTFKWISDKISLYSEDPIKGQASGQDSVTFSDVTEIPKITQNVSITNENSTVTFDRSIIQLLHFPCTNVTRVFNVNTGERYQVSNQNVDSSTSINTTGRIKISGSTLPSPSDTLQVDYNWIIDYDQYCDYDGLLNTDNERTVNDSIDWGYSSLVKEESIVFTEDVGNNFFTGFSTLPINTVLNAKTFKEFDGVVVKQTSGNFVNRLSVEVSKSVTKLSTIDSVKLKNINTEVFITAENSGTFISTVEVVGINLLYTTTVILPKDTSAKVGDTVTVFADYANVFDGGNSNNSEITIPSSNIDTTANAITLKVSYIANTAQMFSAASISLPSSKLSNGFSLNNNNGSTNFSPANGYKRENQIIKKNFSNQIYVELTASALEYTLIESYVVSVIRLNDNLELWNSDNQGTIITALNNNYQLILPGLNTPAINDRVLVVYKVKDNARFQPFTFQNDLIKTRIDTLDYVEGLKKFIVQKISFTNETSISFDIIEPNTDIVLFSGTDGVLTYSFSSTATLSTLVDFTSSPDIKNKKIRIHSSVNVNNDGLYDIVSYDELTNTFSISSNIENISKDQISIIRLLDGKELWNYDGIINTNNTLTLPANVVANAGDKVFITYFKYKNLTKSPTRLISTVTDQVINSGTIVAFGTTLKKAQDIVFVSTSNNLKLNLIEAVRKSLNLNSNVTLPTNIKVVKVLKLEKVLTASASNDEVISVLATYDLKNTTYNSSVLFEDCLANSTFSNFDIMLPSTANNSMDSEVRNLPALGDKMRVSFYYITENDSEALSYTRNGTLYTNKKFALIDKVYISSGFKSSQSARLSLTSFNQPSLGARYSVFYDYLAPKQNERIVINYNYNKLISDVTFAVENSRPINADVLVREAKLSLLDLTMNIVIDDTYKNSSSTVLQNVRDKLLSELATNTLGESIDTPTLINAAISVTGVSRARVIYFNKNGNIGSVTKIQAQRDEYFAPNNLVINTESR